MLVARRNEDKACKKCGSRKEQRKESGDSGNSGPIMANISGRNPALNKAALIRPDYSSKCREASRF